MSVLQRKFISTAGILLGLGVAIGAFGAHALKPTIISHGQWETWKTAELYHFVHGLALLGLGNFTDKIKRAKLILLAFTFGILIFSGSLYVLSITGIKILGAITPIGGVFFILGWILVVFSLKKDSFFRPPLGQ